MSPVSVEKSVLYVILLHSNTVFLWYLIKANYMALTNPRFKIKTKLLLSTSQWERLGLQICRRGCRSSRNWVARHCLSSPPLHWAPLKAASSSVENFAESDGWEELSGAALLAALSGAQWGRAKAVLRHSTLLHHRSQQNSPRPPFSHFFFGNCSVRMSAIIKKLLIPNLIRYILKRRSWNWPLNEVDIWHTFWGFFCGFCRLDNDTSQVSFLLKHRPKLQYFR